MSFETQCRCHLAGTFVSKFVEQCKTLLARGYVHYWKRRRKKKGAQVSQSVTDDIRQSRSNRGRPCYGKCVYCKANSNFFTDKLGSKEKKMQKRDVSRVCFKQCQRV